MRKLSATQVAMLERCAANGGTWKVGGMIFSHATRDSLVSLGLVTSRRYVHGAGRARCWTSAITLTDAGKAYLEGTLTEYPGEPRQLVVTRWGNHY